MHAPAGRKELGPLEKDLCERIASGVSCWSFRRREFDFCVWRGGWSVCLGVLVFVCVCHCIEDSSANAVMKSARSTYAAAWF
jgi:hypothetical protein